MSDRTGPGPSAAGAGSGAARLVRVGVVGIGFGQQVHVPAFRQNMRCEVKAICASSLERAKTVADRLGIEKAFGDWRELVEDPGIDALSIAAVPSVQPEMAVTALARRKPVFCEKPLATSRAAATDMVAAAEAAGMGNMVDFEFPEIEAWRRAKAILDGGGVGELRHVAVSWNVETYASRTGVESWKSRDEAGGGALNSLVSHAFYYLEWFGGPIRRLSARMFRAPGDARSGDSLAILCLELESGAAASLSVSSHAFLGSGHRLEFYGSGGTLVLENPTPDYARGFRLLYGARGSNRLEVVSTDEGAGDGSDDGRITVVARLVNRFVSWVITGARSHPDFRDGLRVQGLLEAARRSNAAGRWVEGPFCPAEVGDRWGLGRTL